MILFVILFVSGFFTGVVFVLVSLFWLARRQDQRERAGLYDPHAEPDWFNVEVPSVLPAELPVEDAIHEPPYPPGSRLVRDDRPFDL